MGSDSSILFPPGSEMKVTPIPLHDTIIRLEALKAAVQTGATSKHLIDIASQFEEYIRNGNSKAETESHDEDILVKVYTALEHSVTRSTATDIVNHLHNAGILFRERK